MTADLQDKIRQRAFELWQAEGHPEGRDYDHWLKAEAELSAGLKAAAAKKAPAKKAAAPKEAAAPKAAAPKKAPAAKKAAPKA